MTEESWDRVAGMSLYPEWSPPKYPLWMRSMSGSEKRFFAQNLAMVPGPVSEARKDGLEHIIPVIIALKMRPSALKRELGKSVWRAIHHASEHTNIVRARIWVKSAIPWSDLVLVRPTHLPSVFRLNFSIQHTRLDAIYAGRFADKGSFGRVMMLRRDTRRMGVDPNPRWGVNRLQREHDAAGLDAAMKESSEVLWAEPWVFEKDGFRFERMISDRDFSYEGFSQKHCVASYAYSAKAGRVVVLRISGTERATFSFDDSGHVELKGFANSTVSRSCRSAAMDARRAFLAQVRYP